MIRSILLALALSLCPALAQGQELHTINLKKAAKGSSSHYQISDASTDTLKMTDPDGQITADFTEERTKTYSYVETTLERADPNKRPTALKRKYDKATIKTADESKPLSYQGKTIIIEKKDGVYRFRFEDGAEITGAEAEHLEEEFSSGVEEDITALLYPTKAVAINEAWKVPMTDFLMPFEKEARISVDHEKASGTGKLLKVYKKDGKLYGDMTITLEFTVTSVHTDMAEIVCQPGALLKMELKQTACIDGTVDDNHEDWTVQFDGTSLIPIADDVHRIAISTRGLVTTNAKEILKGG